MKKLRSAMEEMDFGGLALFLIGAGILAMCLKVLVVLLLTRFLAIQLAPLLARIFSDDVVLSTTPRVHFLAYEIAWLFLIPILSGLIEIALLGNPFDKLFMQQIFGSFGFVNYYLISIAGWHFAEDFTPLRLKSPGSVIKYGVVFVLLTLVLRIILYRFRDSGPEFHNGVLSYPVVFYVVNYMVEPSASALLTIYYLRKSRRAAKAASGLA